MTDVANPAGDVTAPADADLIASVREGSDAAFTVLYERHVGAARGAARSLGASRSDVDDLVSEAFTRVLAALRRGGGPEVAFRPYLMTCVRNAWYDKGRKDGRVDMPGEAPEDLKMALLNVAPDSEDARMVAAAYASLPERWQMVLWHTEVEGQPAAELAPLLGLAPNAVAALAYRAREGLRQAYLQAHLQLPPPDGCRDTVVKLGAYVRDGLSTRDRRRVDDHLKGCEHCTAVMLELQEVSTGLRGVLVPLLLGVSGSAFVSHVASSGGVATIWRWRPRGPKAQVMVAAAVVTGVVGAAIAVAALTGTEPRQTVEAAVPTTTTTVLERPVTATTSAPLPLPTIPPTSPPVVAVTAPPATPVPTVPPTTTTTAVPRVTRTTVRATTTTTTTTTTAPETTTAPTTTAAPATTITTTTPPPTTTTTTTTTAPPPALNVSAEVVGPAYAGLSATMAITSGFGPLSGTGLGRSAVQAEAPGPVTVTVDGAPVVDWGAAACDPGPTCTLAPTMASLVVRLDLSAVLADAEVPITITTSATGASPASITVPVTALAAPPGLGFFAVEHGAVAVAANTVIRCSGESGAKCGENNNNSDLVRVNVAGADLDSSSAALDLPDGASVVHASLRWGGNPAEAPEPGAIDTVRLTPPDGPTATVTAADVRIAASGTAYTARADVTTLLRRAAASGTYTVADVQTGEGPEQFGGWALVVVYRDDTAPRQAIAVFEDLSTTKGVLEPLNATNGAAYSLIGLPAPADPVAVQLGVIAYEGDRGITGDSVTVGAVPVGPDKNNFFASRIDVGKATREPSLQNQYGFDARLVTVDKAFGPADDALAVTFTIAGGNDAVYLGGATVAVPI